MDCTVIEIKITSKHVGKTQKHCENNVFTVAMELPYWAKQSCSKETKNFGIDLDFVRLSAVPTVLSAKYFVQIILFRVFLFSGLSKN